MVGPILWATDFVLLVPAASMAFLLCPVLIGMIQGETGGPGTAEQFRKENQNKGSLIPNMECKNRTRLQARDVNYSGHSLQHLGGAAEVAIYVESLQSTERQGKRQVCTHSPGPGKNDRRQRNLRCPPWERVENARNKSTGMKTCRGSQGCPIVHEGNRDPNVEGTVERNQIRSVTEPARSYAWDYPEGLVKRLGCKGMRGTESRGESGDARKDILHPRAVKSMFHSQKL